MNATQGIAEQSGPDHAAQPAQVQTKARRPAPRRATLDEAIAAFLAFEPEEQRLGNIHSAAEAAAMALYKGDDDDSEEAAAALAAERRADAVWQRALRKRDRLAKAVLRAPSPTAADTVRKLEMFARAQFAKGPELIQFEAELQAALSEAMKTLRALSKSPAAPKATPSPTCPPPGVTPVWEAVRGAYAAVKGEFEDAASRGNLPKRDEERMEAIRPDLNAAWAAVYAYEPTTVLERAEKRNILCDQGSAGTLLNEHFEARLELDARRLGLADADAAVKAGEHPDAAFLTLWDERVALLPMLGEPEEGSPEYEAVWARLAEIERLILTTPAHGVAGAMVQLRTVLSAELGLFSAGESAHDRAGLFNALAALEAHHLHGAAQTWTDAELAQTHRQWLDLNAALFKNAAGDGDEAEWDALRDKVDRVEDELIAARCTGPHLAAAKLDIVLDRLRRENPSNSNWRDAADFRLLHQVATYLRGGVFFDAYAIVEEYQSLGGSFALTRWNGVDHFGTLFPPNSTPRSREIEAALSQDPDKTSAVWAEMLRRGARIYATEGLIVDGEVIPYEAAEVGPDLGEWRRPGEADPELEAALVAAGALQPRAELGMAGAA